MRHGHVAHVSFDAENLAMQKNLAPLRLLGGSVLAVGGRLPEKELARAGAIPSVYVFFPWFSRFHLLSRIELTTVTALLISRCIARGS